MSKSHDSETPFEHTQRTTSTSNYLFLLSHYERSDEYRTFLHVHIACGNLHLLSVRVKAMGPKSGMWWKLDNKPTLPSPSSSSMRLHISFWAVRQRASNLALIESFPSRPLTRESGTSFTAWWRSIPAQKRSYNIIIKSLRELSIQMYVHTRTKVIVVSDQLFHSIIKSFLRKESCSLSRARWVFVRGPGTEGWNMIDCTCVTMPLLRVE